jgi:hypothetical protein
VTIAPARLSKVAPVEAADSSIKFTYVDASVTVNVAVAPPSLLSILEVPFRLTEPLNDIAPAFVIPESLFKVKMLFAAEAGALVSTPELPTAIGNRAVVT